MTEIYFKPYSNRKLELAFFNHLIGKLEDYIHIPEEYKLPPAMISKHLNTKTIFEKLEFDEKLSPLKKQRLLKVISKLPDKIKVAETISKVTVDIVLVKNDNVEYIEFHEKQHRNISDSRLKPIFTTDNKRIEIPRYAHRFLKDIWRVEYLDNFKIVWWDWFEKNQNYDPNNSKKEYSLSGKFSFNELMK